LTTAPFIAARQMGYRYRINGNRPILDAVDLAVERDESLLICGASGSGKSTLCRTFNGLIPHFYGGILRGEIKTAGRSVAEQSVADLFDRVGMVFQNPDVQLFCRTVEQEIAFGLESCGLDPTVIRRRIGETAERLGIEPLLSRNPQELSGGEKHLIAMAAILALKPDMLVMDEPYANLDARHVRRIRTVLRDVHRSGTGVVICEHRLALTVPDVQRMVVLNGGRIVADGPVDTVLRRDLNAWGLEAPLPVTIGRQMNRTPLPLTVADLPTGAQIPVSLDTVHQPDTPVTAGSIVIEVNDLTCRVGEQVLLDRIDFRLRQGECLAVVGANGAGKTTLLRHLMGLQKPSAGTIHLMGRDIAGMSAARLASRIGLAFQNPDNQFFRLKVHEEIAAGPRVLGRHDENWIAELVDLFRLNTYLDRAPYRLSGGEKKRVAFASALAARPPVLALDEPTAGQDFQFRKALTKFLRRMRTQGLAVILVTHDLAFAEQCADRWLLMANGRILVDGPPRQVMADSVAMKQAGLTPTDRFVLTNRQAREVAHA